MTAHTDTQTQLLDILCQASRNVDVLVGFLRSTGATEDISRDVANHPQYTEFRRDVENLDGFLDCYQQCLPAQAMSHVKMGGHFLPFLLLLEEICSDGGAWVSCRDDYMTVVTQVAQKIHADVASIRQCLCESRTT